MKMWKIVLIPRCLLITRFPPLYHHHHHHHHRRLRRHIFQRNVFASTTLTTTTTTQRLFGSKPGDKSNSSPGEIRIEDDQSALPHLDLDRLKETIDKIRHEINYDTYDVNLILLNDDDMREANRESRDVDAPTDILSFPFHEAVRPGVLVPPAFDVPDYYALGDMLIDVPYVIRSCQADQKEYNKNNNDAPAIAGGNAAAATAASNDSVLEEDDHGEEEVSDSDSEFEYETDDGEPDRGVSLAMSKTFDPEQRLHQLLVHGMLHLVGYDHEEDDEYLAMVEREEEILKKLGL